MLTLQRHLAFFYPDSLGQFCAEFYYLPANQHSSIPLTIAPSTLSGLMTVALDLLSTSVCQILFCPFRIVHIFCHLNAQSKLSSLRIEVIQLMHCGSSVCPDCWPLASTWFWFLAICWDRYLFLVLFFNFPSEWFCISLFVSWARDTFESGNTCGVRNQIKHVFSLSMLIRTLGLLFLRLFS